MYEEKSLGVFDSEEDLAEPEDDESNPVDRRVAIWGKYLMRHMRRQLSFGQFYFPVFLHMLTLIMVYQICGGSRYPYSSFVSLRYALPESTCCQPLMSRLAQRIDESRQFVVVQYFRR